MKLLALDTSTEAMSLAVQSGSAVFLHSGAAGAAASSTLIAAIEGLMQQADLRYAQLDAIVFGRGPGSFTGLRTACAVTQGLALGANLKVLPVDTLLAVAYEGRERAIAQGQNPLRILAALDARMGQVYAASYVFDSCLGRLDNTFWLKTPQELGENLSPMPDLLAGNLRPAMDSQLPQALRQLPWMACLPTAQALLALAPALIAQGGLVDAQEALPLYVRDKVALTTSERSLGHVSRP